MRLHSVSFENFKSFRDETVVPLGRITCLIGPNGSGKSNVLYGIETLANAITKDDFVPRPGDHFDGDSTRKINLAAVVELSDGERLSLARRVRTLPRSITRGDLSDWLFRHLKYEVSYANKIATCKISLTIGDPTPLEFISVRRGNGHYSASRRSIEAIGLKGRSLARPPPYEGRASVSELLAQIDGSLPPLIRGLFSGISHTTSGRGIPERTPVREADAIAPDGGNILNELNGLSRKEQTEFDGYLSAATGGALLTVEPRVRGSEMALEATEPGLGRRTPRADLSSGHEHMILLALQLFAARGSVLLLAEPELHLHARAQKRMRSLLCRAAAGLQIVVETHSPLFLGGGPHEAVLLVTKDGGCSHVTPIAPANMDVVRRELGIAHHDSLHHENILFVEGDSEHVAFPAFLSAMSRAPAPRTAVFNLGGMGGIRHLRLLLRYFEADGRRAFVILDGHDRARSSLESLKSGGLLGDNYFMLNGSFEDAFPSGLIAKAALDMARKLGVMLGLAPGDLDRQREDGKDTASILQKHWREATGRDFSKVDLARSLASLPAGDIPEEIKRALEAAMGHFDRGDGGDAGTGG